MAEYGNPIAEKMTAAQRYYFEPTNVKLVRDGDAIKGTWGIPYAAKTPDRFPEAWNYCDIEINYYTSTHIEKAYPDIAQSIDGAREITGYKYHIWVRDLGVVDNYTQNIDPSAFHPTHYGHNLEQVTWTILAIGNNGRRFTTSASYLFSEPAPPKFSKVEYDSSEKTLSTTLTIVNTNEHQLTPYGF